MFLDRLLIMNGEMIMAIVGSAFAIAAGILMFVYVPICGYFTIKLSQRRRSDIPFTWHDFWGLNRANLLFFPSFLDDEGKRFQIKAIHAAKRLLVGVVLGIASLYLTGTLSV